jgi:IS5 family transposase
MIDLRDPLAVLATRMPWVEIEAALAPAFAHRDRAGRLVEGADLFGPTVQVAGAGVSNAGRPRLPLRLMVSLLYLKHAFNLSDEEPVERWSENVVWQFFSGMTCYEPRLPRDATQLGRFRRVLGEAGVEQLQKSTIEAAVAMGAVRKTEFERVIVDTTVQDRAAAATAHVGAADVKLRSSGRSHKAVAHPTDSCLLEVARDEIVRLAKRAGIELKLTHEREGKKLRQRAAGYAHARQCRRPKKVLRRQRTILGSVLRRVQRKLGELAQAARDRLVPWLERAERIRSQRQHDKGKLCAPHAPEVECIGKGKARKLLGFGLKKSKTLTAKQRGWLERRQAIEPTIGHARSDHGMNYCWFKGSDGDALRAVLCSAGFDTRWLLRAIARLGLRGLLLAPNVLVLWRRLAVDAAPAASGRVSKGRSLSCDAASDRRSSLPLVLGSSSQARRHMAVTS